MWLEHQMLIAVILIGFSYGTPPSSSGVLDFSQAMNSGLIPVISF